MEASLVEPSESLAMCSWLVFATPSEWCFRVPINFASECSSYHDHSTQVASQSTQDPEAADTPHDRSGSTG